jgi:hypothetical protein
VVGAYAARIDGPVSGPTAPVAFAALASRARDARALVTSETLDGVHWLRPLTTPARPSPTAKAPSGCTKRLGLSFQRADLELVLATVAELHRFVPEPPPTAARLGKVSVFANDADVCTLLARALEVAGGSLSRVGAKLVAERAGVAASPRAGLGDAIEPEAGDCSGRAPTETSTVLACWSVADVEVVGVAGPPDAPLAVARARVGRAAFARGALVRVGDRVGREGVRVARIDAAGLHGDRDELVRVAPPIAP